MSQVEAGEFVETVAMEYYQPVPAAMFKLSRLRSAKRQTRVKWILGIITRYFFTPPFEHRHLPSDTAVAFDVTVCPLADYFKEQGVPELTEYAACNTDYCRAREFGIELVRSQTIAEGAEHCDFRWILPAHRERSEKAGEP
jgi:ubiquinone biosynthesis protein